MFSSAVIECPSPQECIVLGDGSGTQVGGQEITFDPTAPADQSPVQIGSERMRALACASPALCVAAGWLGQQVAFDPSLPAAQTVYPKNGYGIKYLSPSIACASATECVIVHGLFSEEITLDPQTLQNEHSGVVDHGQPLSGISCPSPMRCGTVDRAGGIYKPATVNEFTAFAPSSSTSDRPVTIPGPVRAIACPVAQQCTTVYELPTGHGAETTIRSRQRHDARRTPVPGEILDLVPYGLACPSASQCTAVGKRGMATTFNPRIAPRAKRSPRAFRIERSRQALVAIACTSQTQCTAVAKTGNEITFDPHSPDHRSISRIDGYALVAVACPVASQCTAIDVGGRQITFSPTTGQVLNTHPIADIAPSALACPTARMCVAVDRNGDAEQGDPVSRRAWSRSRVPGANQLTGIACPAPRTCVAVDLAGSAFVGTARQH